MNSYPIKTSICSLQSSPRQFCRNAFLFTPWLRNVTQVQGRRKAWKFGWELKSYTFWRKMFASIPAKILWEISNLKPFEKKGFKFCVQKSGGQIAPLAPWVRRPWKTSQQVSPCSPYVIIWTAHSGHFSSSQLMEPKIFVKSNLNDKFHYLLHPKVHLFWEGHKNMMKSPNSFSLTK